MGQITMNQKSLHDVHKASKANIEAWLPFQIVSDGEVIAEVSSPYDVHKLDEKPKANHDVHMAIHERKQTNHDVHMAKRLTPWELKYGHSHS